MFYCYYLLFLIYSLMITSNHLMIIVVLRRSSPYFLFIPNNCYVFNFMKMGNLSFFTKNRHFIVPQMKSVILFHCKDEAISKYVISLPKEYYRNNKVSNLCHIFSAKRYKEALWNRYEYM